MELRSNSGLKAALFAASVFIATTAADAAELALAVANSTCNAIKQIGDRYRSRNPIQINYVCKSSGLLAKGLQGGAIHADIYISADREWMDFAVEHGLVSRDMVSSPWANTLVIAVPVDSQLQLRGLQDLATDKVTTVLIGDPSTAPFGRYAKDALEAAGAWPQVRAKIQTRKNIELLADSLAQSSPTTAGILFRTNLNEQLRQVHVIDGKLHKPIRYYLAPLAVADHNPVVADFLKFLQGRQAQDVFRNERFEITGN